MGSEMCIRDSPCIAAYIIMAGVLRILGKESAAHRPFMYAASAADQCGSARYLVIVLYVGMFV